MYICIIMYRHMHIYIYTYVYIYIYREREIDMYKCESGRSCAPPPRFAGVLPLTTYLFNRGTNMEQINCSRFTSPH